MQCKAQREVIIASTWLLRRVGDTLSDALLLRSCVLGVARELGAEVLLGDANDFNPLRAGVAVCKESLFPQQVCC